MSDTTETVRVQPWAEGQGDFVEINATDFDEAVHVLLEGETLPVIIPFADVPRDRLIEMIVDDLKAELADVSDDDLRHGLESRRRYQARREAEEQDNPFDGDGDGKAGGSEPSGGLTKDEVIAELVALGVPHRKADKKDDLLAQLVEARAKVNEAVDPLDIPHEDAGGLTLRELHADAEALGIEIDPLGLVSDLFAKVQAAKAAKAADAAPEAGGGPAPADAPAVECGETQTPASDA